MESYCNSTLNGPSLLFAINIVVGWQCKTGFHITWICKEGNKVTISLLINVV